MWLNDTGADQEVFFNVVEYELDPDVCNSYDLLILVLLDAVYREGTIYSAVGPAEMAWVVLSIVLVSTLMLGLLRRQKHGVGNVGFETVLMLAVYAGGVGAITLS